MARVAINGLGRIGRATLKIVMDTPGLDLVAANEIASAEEVSYLLRYDSVYGRYDKSVSVVEDALVLGGHRLALLNEKEPSRLPWRALDVDIVFECTGAFTRRDDLAKHRQRGCEVRSPLRTRCSR